MTPFSQKLEDIRNVWFPEFNIGALSVQNATIKAVLEEIVARAQFHPPIGPNWPCYGIAIKEIQTELGL